MMLTMKKNMVKYMNRISPVPMAFHFFCSALNGDSCTAVKIASKIVEMRPGDIFSFLLTLGGSIDGHSSQVESEYPPYEDYKKYVCNKIKQGNMYERFYFSVGGRQE